jgi:hypothetical protein
MKPQGIEMNRTIGGLKILVSPVQVWFLAFRKNKQNSCCSYGLELDPVRFAICANKGAYFDG